MNPKIIGDDAPAPDVPAAPVPVAEERARAAASETGGRPGLDPTRYGDWEKNGRCIDF